MAAFDDKEQLSGLAGEIRSSVDSEQFDLGGYTEIRARDLIHAAFTSPLTAPQKMVRFTFVVGGGKLVRSRYADDLSRWLTTALREVGFSEDRSAAETFDSQGTFKQQHDTGQNLKYLIVYPRVAIADQKAPDVGDTSVTAKTDPSSPEYIVVACELSTLNEIVGAKVTSYKQKKQLLSLLQRKAEEFAAIESKLISGAALTAAEQENYDANSGSDQEKITWLQAEIKGMVDSGKLTASEKEELLMSMKSNEEALSEQIETAKSESKPPKVIEVLETKRSNILKRKAAVDGISPIVHRLPCSEQVQKLYMKLFPLRALEDKGRSMSLTLADLKTLEEKGDIEAAIASLCEAHRGWFQCEEDFTAMCELDEREARIKFNARKASASKKKPSGSSTSSTGNSRSFGSGSSSSAWSTATVKKGASKGSLSAGGAKAKASGGSAFAALDSDSD